MVFLEIKKENVDEKIWVKIFFLGLVVLDKYYQLFKFNVLMYLFSFYDVEWEFKIFFFYVDLIKEYDCLVVNLWIKKMVILVCELE